MAETKSTKTGFSAEERAAMKERARELKKNATKEAAAEEQLAKIAEMPEVDRVVAQKIHELVMAAAPDLSPKLWYGMPSYYKDGKVLCFIQPSQKFVTRYTTFGFNDGAKIDDGNLWATSFAVVKLGTAEQKKITDLVKKAIG